MHSVLYSLFLVPPILPPAVLLYHYFCHPISSFYCTATAPSQFPKLNPGSHWDCPNKYTGWIQSKDQCMSWDFRPASAQCFFYISSPWGCRKGPWRELYFASSKYHLGLGVLILLIMNAGPDTVPNYTELNECNVKGRSSCLGKGMVALR